MGLTYGCFVSNCCVKFFPDKRGLVGGITTASYGLSSVIVPLIANRIIANAGVPNAFKILGLGIIIKDGAMAVSILALFNTGGRIIGGFISDRIGQLNMLMSSVAGLFLLMISKAHQIIPFYDMANIMILSSLSRFIQFLVVPLSVIVFYFNLNKEEVLSATKNFATDVIIPVAAFIFSLFLVIKFDWVSQFSIVSTDGTSVLNIAAIVAVVISYIILPVVLLIWKNTRKA
jgi:hypothetical protein